MATSFLAVEMKKTICEKIISDGVEASSGKSHARFQSIRVMLDKASRETK